MINEGLKLPESSVISKCVEKKVKTTGVYNLDLEKAKELGVFTRIANSLCAMHATIVAAYRIYGDVDYLMSELGGRKHEIAKVMNDYERAFGKFFKFWTDYYVSEGSIRDVTSETENLYHQIMKWAQLPENWQIGDKQRLPLSDDIAIKINDDDGGNALLFHKCSVDVENVSEPVESWIVTKYDENEKTQTTINTDIDKSSAMMIAKRLSDSDKDNIYIASIAKDVVEKRTEIIPYKAFKANETIGSITHLIND
jgi:hypothetical protein